MLGLNTSTWKRIFLTVTTVALFCISGAAQTEPFGDDATDPVRLFERGQSAHARGDLEKALVYYEQALKVRPEFPEAEFQRGNALTSLGRLSESDRSSAQLRSPDKFHRRRPSHRHRRQRDETSIAPQNPCLVVVQT